MELNDLKIGFNNKDQVAFDTYFSYLDSISNSVIESVQEIDNFLDTFTKNRQFRKINSKKGIDINKISKILRNAWYTEFQLKNLALNNDFAGFSLHWAQVYSYYTCYLLIRAFILSQNQIVNPKHRNTLRYLSNEIKDRNKLFPSPWNLLCIGDPSNKIENIFLNKSNPFINNHQLSKKAKENPVDNFSKFLKTTREKEIDRKIREWKNDNGKKRVSAKIRMEIIDQTPATSIYDCLYRLRIRANYENADTFIFSEISDNTAMKFHESLQTIVWTSSLILETLIAKYLSSKRYELIIEQYKSNMKTKFNNENYMIPIKRWELFKERVK